MQSIHTKNQQTMQMNTNGKPYHKQPKIKSYSFHLGNETYRPSCHHHHSLQRSARVLVQHHLRVIDRTSSEKKKKENSKNVKQYLRKERWDSSPHHYDHHLPQYL